MTPWPRPGSCRDANGVGWTSGRGTAAAIGAMSKRVRMLLWSIRQRCRPGSELRILHLNQTNALGPALEGLGSVTETLYRPDRPLGSRIGGCFNEDMSRLSFEDNRFDLAVHSETLEHLPDYRRALDEVQRVLKPGGHTGLYHSAALLAGDPGNG